MNTIQVARNLARIMNEATDSMATEPFYATFADGDVCDDCEGTLRRPDAMVQNDALEVMLCLPCACKRAVGHLTLATIGTTK